MNRQDMIDAIADETESSKAATSRFLDAFVAKVKTTVAAGDKVKISGFGTFEKTPVAARTGRNPKTGVPIAIAATYKPKFTPGESFKELVKR